MRRTLLLAALSLAACSSLGDSGAPVAIDVLTPIPAAVDIGDTIVLHARLLDQGGDSVAGTIRWRTPDTTVTVDSITGAFTGLLTGSGRVQALGAGLVSTLIQYTVRTPADSVVVPTDTLKILAADTASAPLLPKVVDSLGAGLSGRTIVLTLVAPSPATARLTDTVVTITRSSATDGTPSPVVRVRKAGVVSGDTVAVKVDARRPSGALIPGSGQKILVVVQ